MENPPNPFYCPLLGRFPRLGLFLLRNMRYVYALFKIIYCAKGPKWERKIN